MRCPLAHQGQPEPGDGASLRDHLDVCDFCLTAAALEVGDLIPSWFLTEDEADEVKLFMPASLVLVQEDGDWAVRERAECPNAKREPLLTAQEGRRSATISRGIS